MKTRASELRNFHLKCFTPIFLLNILLYILVSTENEQKEKIGKSQEFLVFCGVGIAVIFFCKVSAYNLGIFLKTESQNDGLFYFFTFLRLMALVAQASFYFTYVINILIESEKSNSSLKLEKIELANENAELKEKLNLVTEELRELKLKKGNSIFVIKEWSVS